MRLLLGNASGHPVLLREPISWSWEALSLISTIDPVNRTEEIHLPDVDAMVAEDGVGHGEVEICVRHDDLQHIVFADENLPRRRPGHADLLRVSVRVSLLLHALDEGDGSLDSRAQLADRPLVVLVFGGLLPRKPRGTTLHVVARALDLVDEWLHIGRETAVQEYIDIEFLGGRERLRFAEPDLDALHILCQLRNRLVVHGFLLVVIVARKSCSEAGYCRPAITPPSTGRTTPVMKLAWSEARNRSAAAASATWPVRPRRASAVT